MRRLIKKTEKKGAYWSVKILDDNNTLITEVTDGVLSIAERGAEEQVKRNKRNFSDEEIKNIKEN